MKRPSKAASARKVAGAPAAKPGIGLDTTQGALAMSDALLNTLTGMGTDKDKAANTFFLAREMDRLQLDAAYRSDWISRKGVDIPAYDATREWRSWEASSDDLTAITTLEKNLGVQRKTMMALTRGRLYGGGAIIMGVDQGLSTDELQVEDVQKGDLKFLHVVNRYEMSTGPIEWNIMSPYFGQPQYYDRQNPGAGTTIRLHPSRVVRFIGMELPDWNFSVGWGDSVLQAVADAIIATGMVNSSAAQLIAESKIDIVKIPGLSENIANAKYEDLLKKRFASANAIKSVFSMLIVDKEEEWDRIENNYRGLPDVIKLYLLIVSGALDIPATRFLGQSPTGMSATGDSDTRNYYDRVSTEQNVTISPAMERLDEVLIRSALGTRPPEMWYEWNPLWQMDEAAKAAVAVQKATVFQADVTAGLITPLVLQKARQNQLIEDGTYPGLEALIEEFGEDYEEPEPIVDPNVDPNAPPVAANQNNPAPAGSSQALAKPARGVQPAKAAKDMAARIRDGSTPRTLYVRRDVINQDDIKAWAKEQGFTTSLTDMHVTLFYSKQPVDWLQAGSSGNYDENDKGQIIVKAGGPRVMEQFGKATVLAFSNSSLQYRHMCMMQDIDGATWAYEDYTPHITITYDKPPTMDITDIKPYNGPITLGPEIFEEIRDDYDNDTDTVEDAALLLVPPKTPSDTMIADAIRNMAPPQVNVTVPVTVSAAKGRETTRVTKHDANGRIAEFERTSEPMTLPDGKRMKEVTRVTKHDERGRIAEFERTTEPEED
jgi:phage-related protein (TIGR01555 family)